MRAISPWHLLFVLFASASAGQEFGSATLGGKVADTGGKPLAGATVTLNKWSGAQRDLTKPHQATTDQDGRYELQLWFDKAYPLRLHEVFADAKGFARSAPQINLSLSVGEEANLDFALPVGEPITGLVRLPRPVGAQGKTSAPAQRCLITVDGAYFESLPYNARLFLTAADGRFEFYVPAGAYDLAVQTPEGIINKRGVKAGQLDLLLEIEPFAWTETEIGDVFDEFWAAVDRHYSYFFLRKDVDWAALKSQCRPKAVQCTNAAELAKVLQEMLAPLRDVHVWIETPTGRLGTFQSSSTYNGNPQVTLAQIVDRADCGRFAIVGRTKPDSFGYFLMAQQSAATPDNVNQALEAIRKLKDAPGFIVDLRSANGGNELLAQEIARLFCATDSVYAKQKYRSGPGHEDFGPEQQRVLSASADPYTKPVICLIGPGAVSSGEGFVKMMKCLPQVTTVGMPTRGASGNPKPWPVGRTGLTVYFSRWVDLMPEGMTFEGKGIPPEIEVNRPPADYASSDPTLEKGLEVLRAKITAAGR